MFKVFRIVADLVTKRHICISNSLWPKGLKDIITDSHFFRLFFSGEGSEARMDDRSFQQNITFGQLGLVLLISYYQLNSQTRKPYPMFSCAILVVALVLLAEL